MVRFARRMDHIEVSGIRRMFDLSARIENRIDFSIGQPDFQPPAPLRLAARKAIERGDNTYTPTQGIAKLREKLLAYYHKHYRLMLRGYYKAIITSGATGGLFLASMVLIDEGDEVLIPDPYFGLYPELVKLCRGTPVLVDTSPTGFRLTPELIKRHARRKTKILFFNNPVNPTGVAYDASEIQAISAITRKLGILILSDEVYADFCYDFPFSTTLAWCENAVLVGAFSKSFGIPGWRIGFSIGPAEIIEKMTILQQFTFVCPPSVAQHAMLRGLDLSPEKWIRNQYLRKRDLACTLLQDHFEFVRPQGAFYIYPKAPRGDATAFVKKALERKVVIVPGKTFSSDSTHFRVSFAVSDDSLERGLKILRSLA